MQTKIRPSFLLACNFLCNQELLRPDRMATRWHISCSVQAAG